MNKKLKNALQAAFEAPQPVNKGQFLKMLRYPKITYRNFMYSQFCCIQKRVWVLSAAIALAGWFVTFLSPSLMNWNREMDKIWTVSAILPFLALLMVTEIYRSAFYRMAELEMSCRFSLPQIVMARITILGSGNFLILILSFIFVSQVSPYGLLQIVTYLMVPYLLTCCVCLLILNRVRGKESTYCCAAAACFVCIMNIVLGGMTQLLYSNRYLGYWLLLFAAGILVIGIQMRRLLKKMEDRTWNLFLTE